MVAIATILNHFIFDVIYEPQAKNHEVRFW